MMRTYNAVKDGAATPTKPPQTSEATAQPSSGNIDPALIGIWSYETFSSDNSLYVYAYVFNEDGRFSYFVGSTVYDGKYYTDSGKIYLLEMYNTRTGSKWGEERVVEYAVDTDNYGTYLTAAQLRGDQVYYERNSKLKFYKTDSIS